MDEDTFDKTYGMIDISNKKVILRIAIASGSIYLNKKSILSILNKTNPKGDVLENAKLSAIYAVKKTPEMVFLAHPIKINSVNVYFDVFEDRIYCKVKVIATERTGVEIEAIAGVMNALLAILDLCKKFEKDEDGQFKTTRISNIKIDKKIKKK